MGAERSIQINSISEAKALGNGGEIALGNQEEGGLVVSPEGTLYALKHRRFRLNGRKPADYTSSDLVPVCYRIDPLPSGEETRQTVTAWLESLRKGEIPEHATVGVEVEATCYDRNYKLLSPYNDTFPAQTYNHPELHSFTLETATSENSSCLPKTPVETVRAIANAVLDGYKIVKPRGGQLAYSSVAEAGDGNNASTTPHPYLITFAPLIAQFTLDNINTVPPETLEMYERPYIDVVGQMQKGVLNWPVNALHVHTGVPQIEGLADPRAAHACGLVKLTEFSKVLSLMLYNTRHLYGVELGGKDVRSIVRRLIVSSHDATIPQDTETLVQKALQQLREGKIHSLPRYPDTGQHDRMRLRMDGNKKTVESIDAPMNSDLRLVLFWVFANQLKDIIALDALEAVGGDTSQVILYLKQKWGEIFQVIPTMGANSSYEQDIEFNQLGYDGKSSLRGIPFAKVLRDVKIIITHYGDIYPAVAFEAEGIIKTIDRQLTPPTHGITLQQYLGVETGVYMPNGLNNGLVTDYKYTDPKLIVNIQSAATRLQAEALSKMTDEKDLKGFLGI